MGRHDTSPASDAFAAIDQTADPQRFVRYLAGLDADPFAIHVKALSYQLLGARAGLRLLDVGCGLGGDVRALAAIVGQTGSVVGVDKSQTMIDAACQRGTGYAIPLPASTTVLTASYTLGTAPQAKIIYHQADASALPFPDGSFDGVRAERLLQHLAEPEVAIAEMIRVARPGAAVVLVDVDHGSNFEDLPDMALFERLRTYRLQQIAQPYAGRQLYRWLRHAGLHDVTVTPITATYTTGSLEYYANVLDAAVDAAVITREDAATCIDALHAWFADETIFYGFTFFIAVGITPASG